MDGFEQNGGIILMAGTNLPALIRPGRFDMHMRRAVKRYSTCICMTSQWVEIFLLIDNCDDTKFTYIHCTVLSGGAGGGRAQYALAKEHYTSKTTRSISCSWRDYNDKLYLMLVL